MEGGREGWTDGRTGNDDESRYVPVYLQRYFGLNSKLSSKYGIQAVILASLELL